jgi:hypothetical protein
MTRLAAAAVAVPALVLSGAASAAPNADFVSLPSPLAQLSSSPPLAGGASANAEGLRHRVAARTNVVVSLGPDGAPFRVVATQRLDVRVKGDYFFTIGAPVSAVEAAPGSASTPGRRSTSILWAGFNPGRRTLVARAALRPGAVAPSLPLRVTPGPGVVALENTTGVTTSAFTADVLVAPLARYFAQLKRAIALGEVPTSGGALVTSKPVTTRIRVAAPLHVEGTIGARRVDLVLEGRRTIAGSGPVRLTVTPADPARLLDRPVAGLSGRRLLDRVARASLTLSRVRQYRTFLGNPDPTGPSSTTYVYRTAARPVAAAPAAGESSGRGWPLTLAIVLALLGALALSAFAWSRA